MIRVENTMSIIALNMNKQSNQKADIFKLDITK